MHVLAAGLQSARFGTLRAKSKRSLWRQASKGIAGMPLAALEETCWGLEGLVKHLMHDSNFHTGLCKMTHTVKCFFKQLSLFDILHTFRPDQPVPAQISVGDCRDDTFVKSVTNGIDIIICCLGTTAFPSLRLAASSFLSVRLQISGQANWKGS